MIADVDAVAVVAKQLPAAALHGAAVQGLGMEAPDHVDVRGRRQPDAVRIRLAVDAGGPDLHGFDLCGLRHPALEAQHVIFEREHRQHQDPGEGREAQPDLFVFEDLDGPLQHHGGAEPAQDAADQGVGQEAVSAAVPDHAEDRGQDPAEAQGDAKGEEQAEGDPRPGIDHGVSGPLHMAEAVEEPGQEQQCQTHAAVDPEQPGCRVVLPRQHPDDGREPLDAVGDHVVEALEVGAHQQQDQQGNRQKHEVQRAVAHDGNEGIAGELHGKDGDAVEAEEGQQPLAQQDPDRAAAARDAVDRQDAQGAQRVEQGGPQPEQQTGDRVGDKLAAPGHGEGVHHIGVPRPVQVLEDQGREEQGRAEGEDDADGEDVFPLETNDVAPQPFAGVGTPVEPPEQGQGHSQEEGQGQQGPGGGEAADILFQQGRIKE